ncbi:MAG TPA: hypothetical protein PLG17_02190, partial [Thermodesulfobacteriota bacterium]|nr:hypothetical protein [Thermodesulfobacteriota bacterium]
HTTHSYSDFYFRCCPDKVQLDVETAEGSSNSLSCSIPLLIFPKKNNFPKEIKNSADIPLWIPADIKGHARY